jgi:hypothetical protein
VFQNVFAECISDLFVMFFFVFTHLSSHYSSLSTSSTPPPCTHSSVLSQILCNVCPCVVYTFVLRICYASTIMHYIKQISTGAHCVNELSGVTVSGVSLGLLLYVFLLNWVLFHNIMLAALPFCVL